MLQNDSGMNCEIIFTFVFKRQCLCSKRVKVYRFTDQFSLSILPAMFFFLENPLTRDNAVIGKCRQQNHSSHRQEKNAQM